MSNPWCVAPDAKTIDNLVWVDPTGVSRTFWIKVKRVLTVGEERAVQTAGWRGVTGVGDGGGEAEIRIDWRTTSFARAMAYLVDWSLEDDKHNRMPLGEKGLQALHPEVFEIIENAISTHVREMDEEKKARAALTAQTLTSA